MRVMATTNEAGKRTFSLRSDLVIHLASTGNGIGSFHHRVSNGVIVIGAE